jgi:hypothetical protein
LHNHLPLILFASAPLPPPVQLQAAAVVTFVHEAGLATVQSEQQTRSPFTGADGRLLKVTDCITMGTLKIFAEAVKRSFQLESSPTLLM